MPKDVDLLTITDSLCGQGSRGGCTQTDVAAIARLLYGAPASSIRVAKSQNDLVRILQEYSSIRRLVIMLEGSEGQIAVDHYSRALSVYADALQARGPRVQEIVFDNCNVIKSASEVIAFMNALHASKATGAASFHIWNKVTIPIGRNELPEEVENAMRRRVPGWDLLRDYVIGGQPTISQMAAQGGTQTLFFEFFSRDPLAITRLEYIRSISQLHGVAPRSKLVSKTYSVTAARTAEAELDVPAGPISLVTYYDPTAGRALPLPVSRTPTSPIPAPGRFPPR